MSTIIEKNPHKINPNNPYDPSRYQLPSVLMNLNEMTFGLKINLNIENY